MNKLIIVGNGFDLAHGLNTRYSDMLDFFWNDFLDECQKLNDIYTWNFRTYENTVYTLNQIARGHFNFGDFKNKYGINDTLTSAVSKFFDYNIKNEFLNVLININNIENWVDVENEYYKTLVSHLETSKKNGKIQGIKTLNESFESIKDLLKAHLLSEMKKSILLNEKIFKSILKTPQLNELPFTYSNTIHLGQILVLNFNYTDTIERLYLDELKLKVGYGENAEIIHIHGDINKFETNPMIFGYGDELDRYSKDIVDVNNSEFLRNVKSISYQFSSNYKNVLQFLSRGGFQAVIMGHSCGNSDRTLLNTIFEHENCVSIKPYYHKWDGGDNYFDIVCNIYRNFTKNSSFREKVVEKNLCETLT